MTQAAFMETLTYEGDPLNVFALQSSDLWTVRGPASFTSTLSVGDTFRMIVDDFSGQTILLIQLLVVH